MSRLMRVAAAVPATLIALFCVATPVLAQEEDEKELGFFYTAELGFTLAGGNASSNSLAFGAGIRHEWERATWLIEGGGLRAEQTTRTRVAVGTDPSNFTEVETTNSALTAETYFANTRYDRMLGGNWYAFGVGAWLRNQFAGIDSRWTLGAGVGNAWWDNERVRFKTDYGITYTNQNDIVPDPSVKDSYIGLGASADFWYQVTASTDFISQFFFNTSFAETSNWRSNWLNSIQVAMSDALALKASLLFQYNNKPALEVVSLDNPLGTPTGQSVAVELDKLDTFFTIALVLSM